MRELDLIGRLLRPVARHPAARGLLSDAAVFRPEAGPGDLVLTKDMMASGVHFRMSDNPRDVGWKLGAVNLSDLAASGAQPSGCLLGLAAGPQVTEVWLQGLVEGLADVCATYAMPLIGGDSIALPKDAGANAILLSLTAFGHVPPDQALGRTGARIGDTLWLSGYIGDAAFALDAGGPDGVYDNVPPAWADRLHRPVPRMELGVALRRLAHACMDVSDGLLADARRLASASGVAVHIFRDDLPLSAQTLQRSGRTAETLVRAATGGDDYELLFAAAPDATADILAISQRLGLNLSPVGTCVPGQGVALLDGQGRDLTPDHLGYEHGKDQGRP